MAALPVAIIGLACRLPGCRSPEGYWDLLLRGVDSITEVPAERWSLAKYYDPEIGAPAKMSTRWGGFIDHIDEFDAGFFGISRREALQMEPQQRVLLEVTWEAIERAGIAPGRLAGSAAGVFVGVSSFDYYERILEDAEQISGYTLTGNAYSITANRLSYVLDLGGPSIAVDTACSSSLVAVHLACQSLRAGESTLAIAAGVHIMLSPWVTVACSKGEMMSPDGRCHTFDARANGYVRGEGVGVVLLKPLPQALADGDMIHAVIRGSAVNQDGRSNGLTAPNQQRQRAVMRAACINAGVAPAQLGYVEAHGTGTRVGDPIEMEALGSVLREGRPPGSLCLVGSGKTNIGHLEAASGVAGLIKTALVVEHGVVPRHLHFDRPNPLIDFTTLPVEVPRETTQWKGPGPRLAGINSFGFGGTNAHVILEEPPPALSGTRERVGTVQVLPLSAKSEQALRELSSAYAARFGQLRGSESIADVCFTAGTGRDHFHYRAAVIAESAAEFSAALTACASGKPAQNLKSSRVRWRRAPRLAFLFTGQGSQYHRMGHELFRANAVFRGTLARCDEILRPWLPNGLIDTLYGHEASPEDLNRAAFVQPALFALGAALTDVFRSWGVTPAAVLGHSLGEYIACYAAGVLALEEGLRVVAERGRLMQRLPRIGAMVSVFAEEETVRNCLATHAGVEIAAVNGPDSIVISGDSASVGAAVREMSEQGLQSRPLDVSHAFHSKLMQPIIADFREVLNGIRLQPPAIALISNVIGERIGAQVTTADYWCRHVLEPVRFADGLAALRSQKPDAIIEIGARPMLSALARRILPADTLMLPTLRGAGGELNSLLDTLGTLYVYGMPVDWAGVGAGAGRRCLVPTYPFQRQRYWIQDEFVSGRSAIGQESAAISSHPFLARARRSALDGGAISFQIPVDLTTFPYLKDHCIRDTVVLPASAYVEMVRVAAAEVFKGHDMELEEMEFAAPFVLSLQPSSVCLVLNVGNGESATFDFSSQKSATGREPNLLARGRLGRH